MLQMPVYKEPKLAILGKPGIVQHEVLNSRRHMLTKNSAGSVKLWEITRGVVVEDYGKVSIPAWFTVDMSLGSLSVHLDSPHCFSVEMFSVDLNITGKLENDKVVNYVLEKMVLEKPLDSADAKGSFAPGGHEQHLAVGDGPL